MYPLINYYLLDYFYSYSNYCSLDDDDDEERPLRLTLRKVISWDFSKFYFYKQIEGRRAFRDHYSYLGWTSQEGWKFGKCFGNENRCEWGSDNSRESAFHLQFS